MPRFDSIKVCIKVAKRRADSSETWWSIQRSLGACGVALRVVPPRPARVSSIAAIDRVRSVRSRMARDECAAADGPFAQCKSAGRRNVRSGNRVGAASLLQDHVQDTSVPKCHRPEPGDKMRLPNAGIRPVQSPKRFRVLPLQSILAGGTRIETCVQCWPVFSA